MPAPSAGLPRAGLIILAFVTLFWGLNWPVMKVVLGFMDPWTFRTIVVPTAGIILLILARSQRLPTSVPVGMRLPLIMTSLFNVTGWHVFSAWSLTELSSGEGALIAFTMPLWASVLSFFILGERLTGRRILALLLGMTGVSILLGVDVDAMGASPLGAAYMLAAATTWGTGVVLLKRFPWNMPTISLAGWQLVVGGIPIVLIAAVLDPGLPVGIPAEVWGLIAFVIVGPMCFCAWGFFKVVSLFPAAVSAISTLMVPVVGVLAGSVALGEPLGLRELIAMLLVCGGLSLTLLRT